MDHRMKQIPGFPNYSVTKDGRVWSKPRRSKQGHKIGGCWLVPSVNNKGYLSVGLYTDKRNMELVHRLVLETYVGPCPEGMECRHLDGDHLNNQFNNLEWGTKEENYADRVKHGRGFNNRGEQHGLSKLTEDRVRLIFNAYHDGTYTQRELADYFGIRQQTVSDIVKKRRWGWLWDD